MSKEALQIAKKRKEAKNKREKERYTQPNADFQRIARRDKKAFLGEQCKKRGGQNLNPWTAREVLSNLNKNILKYMII